MLAKEDNLGPLAAPKDKPPAGFARPPNGDVVDLAKLPNPETLNFSSEVMGRSAFLSPVVKVCGFEAMAAKGDSAEVLEKPLPSGDCTYG